MTTGVVVLLVAVVGALALGGLRLIRDGRFRRRTSAGASESVLTGTAYDGERGERATLLQFSSAFCAPCRATRATLGEVARIVPGVVHVEVDAEQHLELVRRLGIMRTPTTLVLDDAGREVSRASGAPTRQSVIAGLDWIAQ